MIGMLVVDERPYPIARVVLAEGCFQFWVDLPGSVSLPARSEARIHAPDGSLILCAPWRVPTEGLYQLRDARDADDVHICFPLSIAEVRGWPATRVERQL